MNVTSKRAGLYPSMTLALRRRLQWTHLTPFDLTISDDTLALHGIDFEDIKCGSSVY